MAESKAEFIARIGLFGDPVADPAAVVVRGNARFTVLTDRLLRLEWAPDGRFTDRASYAFPTRRGPVPTFTAADRDGETVIDTGALRLCYRPDGGSAAPFSPANLSIELTDPAGVHWQPGLRDRHNLGGARRTVDTCRGDARLEDGLVSRSGWAVHDDGSSMLFDADGWVRARPATGAQDWYFFGYGHDYPAAVRDYTRFGGAVPLIPRWMLGAWWSRYWAYTDQELRELVTEFTDRGLPLDVLVIDMDWHLPDSWTGYTWNRELFPDPAGFLGWLHERGLHSTLNLHPALGVQPFEQAYPEFVRTMGLAANDDDGPPVPFHISDPAYAQAYFELLHHPLEDQGVDFWWMDWQQGRTFGEAGIDPLPWLNHLHFVDLGRRPDRRPVAFSRWGGLGSHRYPIGFSGDSFARWSALRFQPRYTAAGANVGYGWWSHDIGGHVGPDDPELYVRWLQFGAVSPILRLHSNQDPASERRPWRFGEPALDAARAAFALRYELVPYLYTAARTAAETGLAPVRPLAWLAPADDSAYAARYEYLLGDQLLVAPVVHPAEPSSGLATVDVWLPAGDWIERTSRERFTGPCWVRQLADLRRVPQFVRPGAVLPLAEPVGPTRDQGSTLVLEVHPGGTGSGRRYTDDGSSSAYRDGQFSWTEFGTSTPSESRCDVWIVPDGIGAGDDAPRYTVRLVGTRRPARVLLDGQPHDGWWQRDDVTEFELPVLPAGRRVELTVIADGPISALGPEHDALVRTRDLQRLLGSSAAGDELAAAALALPADHPSRPAALARLGGPALRVDEHTAPDEAAGTLGRLVVGLGAGEQAELRGSWTLHRGTDTQVFPMDPVAVTGAGLVLDAPFRWDDTLTPARWTLDATVRWLSRWGEVVIEHRHHSGTLTPALASWAVAVTDPDGTPEPADFQLYQADPFDLDFAELTDRFGPPIQHGGDQADRTAHTVHARTRFTLAGERPVAFAYYASDDLTILVDGEPVPDEVTGRPPVRFYDLDPRPRRTGPVRLAAGPHELTVRSAKAAELPWHQWCLSVEVVDPDDDRPLLEVDCDASRLVMPAG